MIESGESAREIVIDGRRYKLVPVDAPVQGAPEESVLRLLTPREVEVVALVARGRLNKEVARDLEISEWTVSTHLRRVFAKLGVDTRAAMVRRCAADLAAGRLG